VKKEIRKFKGIVKEREEKWRRGKRGKK